MASGSVPITAGTGTPIRVVTNAAVDSGANQQVFSLADAFGVIAPSDPDGTMQVSPDSKGLFLDAFDVSLAAWTTGGTAPTVSGGAATFASSTTASGSSFMRTNGTFLLRPQAYLRPGFFVQLGETTSSITNNTRWWGYGQNQSTPTAAAPVLNGAVFVVDYADGALYGAIYSAGTRTQRVAIARPTDGALHKYEIWFRQAIVYFLIDGVPVGSIALPNTAVTQGMYLIAGSTNFTTAPGTAPVLKLSSASMADTSGTVGTVGDGDNPYIQVSVKAASTAVAATDKPMAVGLHPSSPLPAGTNQLGGVSLNTGAAAGYAAVTTAAVLSASIKASAGNVLELTVSNPTSTAFYVKLYNKASAPTVGTDIPLVTFRVAAAGSVGDVVTVPFPPLGKRFNTGIAIGVSAGVLASDTAAPVAGGQISVSYV